MDLPPPDSTGYRSFVIAPKIVEPFYASPYSKPLRWRSLHRLSFFRIAAHCDSKKAPNTMSRGCIWAKAISSTRWLSSRQIKFAFPDFSSRTSVFPRLAQKACRRYPFYSATAFTICSICAFRAHFFSTSSSTGTNGLSIKDRRSAAEKSSSSKTFSGL